MLDTGQGLHAAALGDHLAGTAAITQPVRLDRKIESAWQ
jgi:hypothetical protein